MKASLEALAAAAEALVVAADERLSDGTSFAPAAGPMTAAADAARSMGGGVAGQLDKSALAHLDDARGESGDSRGPGPTDRRGSPHPPSGLPDPAIGAQLGDGVQAVEGAAAKGAEVADDFSGAVAQEGAPGGDPTVGDILQHLADIISDFIPVLSELKDAASIMMGKNPITGDRVDGLEAFIAGIPILGAVFKLFKRIFKAIASLFKTGGEAIATSLGDVGKVALAEGPVERRRLFAQTTTIRDPSLRPGEGATDKYGNVRVSPHGTPSEQKLALYHEQVHSALSPKLNFLREFRANVATTAYQKSELLRYLEEALAETVAQLRVNGVKGALDGLKFPVKNGYVTVGGVAKEAGWVLVGTVTIAGTVYTIGLVSSGGSDQNTLDEPDAKGADAR